MGGEKILGVCVESYNEKNKWIHIAWLLTNPKGQGVGGKLLNHLDELYLQTAQTLHTNVNGRAKNLYQRHGFVFLWEKIYLLAIYLHLEVNLHLQIQLLLKKTIF